MKFNSDAWVVKCLRPASADHRGRSFAIWLSLIPLKVCSIICENWCKSVFANTFCDRGLTQKKALAGRAFLDIDLSIVTSRTVFLDYAFLAYPR